MESNLSNAILLLKEDYKKIEQTNFSILFSFNRNAFFSFLNQYIAFYNQVKSRVEKLNAENPSGYTPAKLPKVSFENYSLSPVLQLLLILFLPLAFIIFLLQWSYIREVKQRMALAIKMLDEWHDEQINVSSIR